MQKSSPVYVGPRWATTTRTINETTKGSNRKPDVRSAFFAGDAMDGLRCLTFDVRGLPQPGPLDGVVRAQMHFPPTPVDLDDALQWLPRRQRRAQPDLARRASEQSE